MANQKHPGIKAVKNPQPMTSEREPVNWDDIIPPRLFREVVEQASAAISITDEHANILYANPAFERTTGYEIAEALGCNEHILSSQHTPKIVYETLWNRINSGKAWNGLLLNKKASGQSYVADLSISPVTNASGEITNFLGIHRDISDIYELEHRATNQKKLIETVINAAPYPMAVLHSDRSVMLDNLAYKTLSADLGAEPANVIADAAQVEGEDTFNRYWEQRRSLQQLEIELALPAGRRWFQCSFIWFHQKDARAEYFFDTQQNDFVLFVANDVSQYKFQQEALRLSAMRALIAEQEHEESMREAMSGAIFQLQGPLNMIAAAYGMLCRREDKDPALRPLSNVLQDAIDKGKYALDNLRNCMPETLAEPASSVNLNELIRDVLGLFTERMLRSGVTVEWKPQKNLPTLTGQAGRLRGALKQLMDNALDALCSRGLKRRELYIETRVVNDDLEISIRDTGPGIDQALQLKVFEPFFTTKGAHASGGMGLALVQSVVSDHQGAVSINNHPGGGCIVALRLPKQ